MLRFRGIAGRALKVGGAVTFGTVALSVPVYAQTSVPDVPKFTLDKPRYDQTAYTGRLKSMFDMIDPRTIFVSDEQIKEYQYQLENFRQGRRGEVSDENLWKARKIVEANIHPATGDKMLIAGRMSAFLPMNIPIVCGMLMHGPQSTAAMVFWQWVNQSYNVVNNYTNRSGENIEWGPLMASYGLAVAASVTIALGAGALLRRNPSLQKLGSLVPYIAVITAGTCNVSFTRMEEMRNGITVYDKYGNALGTSPAAAQMAVFKTVTSRSMFLPIFPLLVPPATMALLNRSILVGAGPKAKLAAELVVIACALGIGLPAALAIQPQQMTLPVSSLEEHIRKAAEGEEMVYANKGL